MSFSTLKTSCPVDALMKLLGQRWNTYILWILYQEGPLRFRVFKKRIPTISQKVLTEKLRELETTGILHRDYKNTIPPTVTYSLTQQGQDLIPILQATDKIAHLWRAKGYI